MNPDTPVVKSVSSEYSFNILCPIPIAQSNRLPSTEAGNYTFPCDLGCRSTLTGIGASD